MSNQAFSNNYFVQTKLSEFEYNFVTLSRSCGSGLAVHAVVHLLL